MCTSRPRHLILDDTTLAALKFAAKRGVEVIIIMPHIPDKLYAYLLARSYYAELLRAGVQIYEYTPGFIHAKMFTSDDEKAVVGTINLDFRSLYLHFECASYFFRNAVVMDVEEDFQKTLAKSERINSGKLPEVSVYPAVCGEGAADSGAAYVGEGRKTWNGTMEDTAAAGRIQRMNCISVITTRSGESWFGMMRSSLRC